MQIAFVEVRNFRKLCSVRIDFSDTTTLFVGANNSGKTSAMIALSHFLVDSERFKTNDFTLLHWAAINAIGLEWEALSSTADGTMPDVSEWFKVAPSLDLWLSVADNEVHYVSKLFPTLEWNGGLLGVRLQYEPKKVLDLYTEYTAAIADVRKTKHAMTGGPDKKPLSVKLWPEDLMSFLERRLRAHFTVRCYSLDPRKCKLPENGVAQPQALPHAAQPIEGSPLAGLIRIDEINAQRGFGQLGSRQEERDGRVSAAASRETRKLSDQLRSYFSNHLDPFDKPTPADLVALEAIEVAQKAFDERLEVSFGPALKEVQGLGYPGVTDPRLKVSTRLRPTDGLDHDAAVQYEVDTVQAATASPVLLLPEDYNGLGYQNLISMIFRLMSFRDAWMRVGKAGQRKSAESSEDDSLPPLHLVLVEEPEAHLHAQVQQIFIRKAYSILRAHADLGKNERLKTQMIVSTHSSHVAHETSFGCLRYFRRLPAGMAGPIPVSTVVNLSEVFGDTSETERFVARYLRSQHCDLFFADAAILVEGMAERVVVPNFVRSKFEFLNQCYITWLEIGGSHAHRLAPLITHLGLLTLVITDLDAGAATSRVAEPPARGKGQLTNNTTLQKWLPKHELIDKLLDAPDADKFVVHDPLCSVRVAYQTPTPMPDESGTTHEFLANTFEDALVAANLTTFATMKGYGLIAKFRTAIATHKEPVALAQELFTCLRDGKKKAEFALDVIDYQEFEKLIVPTYISDGLTWLDKQLRKKQAEVLPVIASGASK